YSNTTSESEARTVRTPRCASMPATRCSLRVALDSAMPGNVAAGASEGDTGVPPARPADSTGRVEKLRETVAGVWADGQLLEHADAGFAVRGRPHHLLQVLVLDCHRI